VISASEPLVPELKCNYPGYHFLNSGIDNRPLHDQLRLIDLGPEQDGTFTGIVRPEIVNFLSSPVIKTLLEKSNDVPEVETFSKLQATVKERRVLSNGSIPIPIVSFMQLFDTNPLKIDPISERLRKWCAHLLEKYPKVITKINIELKMYKQSNFTTPEDRAYFWWAMIQTLLLFLSYGDSWTE
jgi:hypothetical protein